MIINNLLAVLLVFRSYILQLTSIYICVCVLFLNDDNYSMNYLLTYCWYI